MGQDTELTFAQETDSSYVDALLTMMVVAHEAGDAGLAVDIAEQLLLSRHDLPVEYFLEAGNLHVALGQAEKGFELYSHGLEAYPYNHLLLYQVGLAHYNRQEYERAIGYFQESITIQPFFASAHQMLGNIMSRSTYRTKAVLSWLTYLAIEPNENWVLLRLNALVNEALRTEGSIQLSMENTAFEAYDELLRSRAVFDSRYRSEIDFVAPAAQQSELLINKLAYVEGTGDFWMDFYVPYLQKISDKKLTTDFVYFMLYSSGNESVTKWVLKHEKGKEAWVSVTNELLESNRLRNTRTVLDTTGVFQHWYDDDGALRAIGLKQADGRKTGPSEYYHANGRLRARGRYGENGQKLGIWRYYHNNGILESVCRYNEEGEIEGTVWNSDESDRLVSRSTYVDGKIDGTRWEYYPSGIVKEEVDYQWGRKHGIQRRYFQSGKLMEELQWEQDQRSGWHRKYSEDGVLEAEYYYKNGAQ